MSNNQTKNSPRTISPSRLRLDAKMLLLALPIFVLAACPKSNGPDNSRVGISVRSGAESPSPAIVPSAVAFNGERVMDHVRKQIEIGPHVAGSPEIVKSREYIINELKSAGLGVSTDEFTASTPMGDKKMVNVIGEIPGESKDVIIIASHYDTKYFKDMYFVGANDPAASV